MFHLDEARTEAIEFGLVPNRSNVRRVVKAHDLVSRGLVRHQATFENDSVYLVMSQNNPSQIYTVLRNGKIQCTCPDYQKHDELCKHGLSVLLHEEEQRDEVMIAKLIFNTS
jgi:uncharacterized Zn finger protein